VCAIKNECLDERGTCGLQITKCGTFTLRVILCQVKKENVGIPVPYYLSWKVYLGTNSIPSLKVFKHGHNGIAFERKINSKHSHDDFVLSP
jgi:hypothetical protein